MCRTRSRRAPLGCVTSSRHATPFMGGWTNAGKKILLPGDVARRARVIRFALAGSASVSWYSGMLFIKSGTVGAISFFYFLGGG
jgi:hypothetical protein